MRKIFYIQKSFEMLPRNQHTLVESSGKLEATKYFYSAIQYFKKC